jgi:ABC-type Fe3+/spermidine/putrescine transport system ATPase subunit
VEGIDLDVGAQEFLTMVGPSGCGKSTILRLIAGLEEPTAGDVFIDGQRVNDVSPKDRGIGFMFQGYALFSHMTVAENIEFGLRVRKVPSRQRRERVAELVSLVGLDGLESRKPSQLSGGQQQRVALARALAPQPRLLLLDEPFGALDAKVRQRLRVDTKRLQRELKIPIILVTHDQREALELGDRVAVMSHGRFEQIAIPAEVYDNPQSEFVARFIGRTNIFQTELEEDHILFTKGTRLDVMVRPEEILVSALPEPLTEMPTMVGTITEYSFLGRSVRLEVTLTNGTICTVALPKGEALKKDLALGSPVSLEITACHAFLQEDGAYAGNGSGSQKAIPSLNGKTAGGTSKPLALDQAA